MTDVGMTCVPGVQDGLWFNGKNQGGSFLPPAAGRAGAHELGAMTEGVILLRVEAVMILPCYGRVSVSYGQRRSCPLFSHHPRPILKNPSVCSSFSNGTNPIQDHFSHCYLPFVQKICSLTHHFKHLNTFSFMLHHLFFSVYLYCLQAPTVPTRHFLLNLHAE